MQKTYNYPKQLQTLIHDAEYFNKKHNVWFSIHTFKDTGRVKKNALPIKALWVDIDNTKILPESISPKPTICWQTSEGKHQAVWILTEPIDPVKAERINKHLTYKIGGDKGKWALTTVLRVPESLNHKYEPPQKGFVVWDNGPEYDLAEIEPTGLEIQDLADSLIDSIEPLPENIPTEAEAYKEYGTLIPAGIWKLLNAVPTKEDDWSTTLYKIEIQLAENNIPPEYIFALVRECPWNKYKRDHRPEEQLWIEVNKVYNEAKLEDKGTSTGGKLEWIPLNTLLRYTRKPEWLVKDIWMEENVGWLAGVGKSYKSTLSLDLAMSIASGIPFLGRFEILEKGPVLMIQEEDPDWRVATRLQSIAEHKKLAGITMVDTPKQLTMEIIERAHIPLYCSIGKGFSFMDKEFKAELEVALEKYKPIMVILDPMFMMSAGVDEYKASEISMILNQVKAWRNRYHCAFCIVHHYRKGAGEAHEKVYGSMALYAWSENSLFVSRKAGSHTVIDIQRDIKDALITDSMSVDFSGAEQGDFKVMLDSVAISVTGKDSTATKIFRYLKERFPANTVNKQELVQFLGMSDKTVQRTLNSMKEKGIIEVDYKGVGGKAYIIPNVDLFNMEVIFDI